MATFLPSLHLIQPYSS